MTSTRLIAAGIIGVLSSVALAAEMMGGGGRSGAADADPNTTAILHCEGMTGPQRDACMRQVREREGSPGRTSQPAASGRAPGSPGTPETGIGATGGAPGELGTSRSDIGGGKQDRSEPRKKESSRPPVKPAPAESRTPEDAAARAADPKAPTGALIIDTPSGKLR